MPSRGRSCSVLKAIEDVPEIFAGVLVVACFKQSERHHSRRCHCRCQDDGFDLATLFLAQLDGEELHALLRESQSAVEDAARAFM
jgi:hypothetical protein